MWQVHLVIKIIRIQQEHWPKHMGKRTKKIGIRDIEKVMDT